MCLLFVFLVSNAFFHTRMHYGLAELAVITGGRTTVVTSSNTVTLMLRYLKSRTDWRKWSNPH